MKLLELVETTRPYLDIDPEDRNAGEVISAVCDGIRQISDACDMPARERREAIDAVRVEMMSGDYEHLLDVARRYFVLAGEERDE